VLIVCRSRIFEFVHSWEFSFWLVLLFSSNPHSCLQVLLEINLKLHNFQVYYDGHAGACVVRDARDQLHWRHVAAYSITRLNKSKTTCTRVKRGRVPTPPVCVNEVAGVTWANRFFLTLLFSLRRCQWLHWLKVSHTGCLIWTSEFGLANTTLAPLRVLVVSKTPLPLQNHVRTFYIARYTYSTVHPSLLLNPLCTYTIFHKRKAKRKKTDRKKENKINLQFWS